MRLRNILEHPLVYQYFQQAGGFFGARGKAITRFLPLSSKERVADVGCGPGFIAETLPRDIVYYGFDTDRRYIDFAREKFGSERVSFFCQPFDRSTAQREGPFDVVMLNGLLHHLPDAEVIETMQAIRESLRPGGRVFTLDGCYVRDQSWIERMMLKYDRGEYVRNEAQYRALMQHSFGDVEAHVDHSLSWFPYSWIVMLARV